MDENIILDGKLPLISIITVSFNAEATIEDIILSVNNQSYPNIEYIIIDGKSTDNTLDIIKKHEGKITYWISEPDKGIYDAMNKGLYQANGDWVLFMGADDIFYNNSALDICRIFNNNNIYYGNVIIKSRNKVYPEEINSAYQLCITNFCHQAVFYPRSIYKNYEYDTDYTLWADYVYNLNLYSKFRTKFIYLESIISIFNDKGLGSQSKDLLFMKNRLELIKQLFGIWLYLLMKFRYFLTDIKNGF